MEKHKTMQAAIKLAITGVTDACYRSSDLDKFAAYPLLHSSNTDVENGMCHFCTKIHSLDQLMHQ